MNKAIFILLLFIPYPITSIQTWPFGPNKSQFLFGSIAVASAILIKTIYKHQEKQVLAQSENIYENRDNWSIFNENQAEKNLVFYLPGHRSIAKTGVSEQIRYTGNPLTYLDDQTITDNICEIMPRFSETLLNREYQSYFGQKGDILQALSCIKKEHRRNTNKFHIVGRSRGAHVTAIILGILCTPNHTLLREADIKETERIAILKKLQAGTVLLVVPLINMYLH